MAAAVSFNSFVKRPLAYDLLRWASIPRLSDPLVSGQKPSELLIWKDFLQKLKSTPQTNNSKLKPVKAHKIQLLRNFLIVIPYSWGRKKRRLINKH